MTHFRDGKFTGYVCTGDSVTLESGMFEVRATIEADHDTAVRDFDGDNYTEEQCSAWFNNEWRFVGVVLSLWLGEACVNDHAASLWGIDCNLPGSDNDYLNTVAAELLPEARTAAQRDRGRLLALLNAA